MTTYTIIHVLISLAAIGSGLIVMYGLVTAQRLGKWTALFLGMSILTDLTGFGFHRDHILPSHIVGVISLAFIAVAIHARYVRHLLNAWRWSFALCAVAVLYLNVFVLVVQLFLKVPAIAVLAPTQTEPPFAATQGLVLAIFVIFAVVATRKFYPPAKLKAA